MTADEFAAQSGLDGWSYESATIRAEVKAASFPAAGALVAAIAEAAEAAEHHPDLTLRYPGVVGVELTTHDEGGVTNADVDLARTISALAASAGATVQAPAEDDS